MEKGISNRKDAFRKVHFLDMVKGVAKVHLWARTPSCDVIQAEFLDHCVIGRAEPGTFIIHIASRSLTQNREKAGFLGKFLQVIYELL